MVVAEGDLETNLERSADTEDTVVGLLSRKTLDGCLDDVVLFGDEVVEPDSSQRCSVYRRHGMLQSPDKRRPGNNQESNE